MKRAAASEADATPKLTASCCTVLAIVLASLVCSATHVGICQRVHAGVLRRGEETVDERLQHDDPNRRAGIDRREEHQHDPQRDGVDDQHLAIAEFLQDARQRRFEAHRRQRLRHDEQSGLNRRESQSHLVEQRQQERQAADPQPRQQAPCDGNAKAANSHQAETQQRVPDADRMQAVGGEQRSRDRQQSHHFAPAQGVLAEHFEHIGEQRDSGAEDDEPDQIQPIISGGAVVRKVPVHQYQADQADRDVDEENDAPVKIADDQPADERPQHRTDQAGNGDEAHGADQFRFGKRPHHRQTSHRQHHGAAAALQNPARHQ